MSGEDVTGTGSPDTVLMCSLRAGVEMFGIETAQIREVLGSTEARPVPLAPSYIDGVVCYRGEVLTMVSLRALLGMERREGANCVIVLDDEANAERFGLVVDGVGGVVVIAATAVEPNPRALDAPGLALFDGICRTKTGLMVRLDPQRLRPSCLAESGLFDRTRREGNGERV